MKKNIFIMIVAPLAAAAVYAQTAQTVPAQPTQSAPAPFMQNTQALTPVQAAQAAPGAQQTRQADPEKFAALFPEIKGLTPKIEPAFWENAWHWFALAAVLVVVFAALLLRKKKPRNIPPAEHAIARISRARDESDTLEAKPYAREVSQAVRDYIEDVHDIPAPERTTQEFLKIAALAPAFDETEHELLRKLLTLSDMAKFAKHSFKDGEKTELARIALEFVNYDDKRIEGLKKGKNAETNSSVQADEKTGGAQ